MNVDNVKLYWNERSDTVTLFQVYNTCTHLKSGFGILRRTQLHSTWEYVSESLFVKFCPNSETFRSLHNSTEGETYCIHPTHFKTLDITPVKWLKWEQTQLKQLSWRKEENNCQSLNKTSHRRCRCSPWHWNAPCNPSSCDSPVLCQNKKPLDVVELDLCVFLPFSLRLGEMMEGVRGVTAVGGAERQQGNLNTMAPCVRALAVQLGSLLRYIKWICSSQCVCVCVEGDKDHRQQDAFMSVIIDWKLTQ